MKSMKLFLATLLIGSTAYADGKFVSCYKLDQNDIEVGKICLSEHMLKPEGIKKSLMLAYHSDVATPRVLCKIVSLKSESGSFTFLDKENQQVFKIGNLRPWRGNGMKMVNFQVRFDSGVLVANQTFEATQLFPGNENYHYANEYLSAMCDSHMN